ncbi:MAG: MopE-related protein, partial [Myxococcota bacterium]|nr:MopE-related protein [Myxococcota bacterium]
GKGESCNGEGGCGIGIVVCNAANEPTCSTNPDGPLSQALDEICDGVDNDCDGVLDEGFTYGELELGIGEACDGIGECGEGVVECLGGVAVCSSDPLASQAQDGAEICDGLDNDCNGIIDDAPDPIDTGCKTAGGCGADEVNAECIEGLWVCDYSAVEAYEDEEVSCDQIDNDCDSLTDESWPLGEACDGPDTDLCSSGTWTCTEDQTGAECANEVLPDQEESCDGVDNDCDGFVDEIDGLTAADSSCVNTGVCGNTEFVVIVCDGEGTACNFQGVPGFEAVEVSCDNLDNDCDGAIDEGLNLAGALKGEPCDGQGACGEGVVECHPVDLVPMCSTEASGSSSESVAELCQGLDDDCDGLTDEDFLLDDVPLGDSCVAQGLCGLGTVECAPSG